MHTRLYLVALSITSIISSSSSSSNNDLESSRLPCDQGPYLMENIPHHWPEGIGQAMLEVNLALRLSIIFNLTYLPIRFPRPPNHQSPFVSTSHNTDFYHILGFDQESCNDDVAIDAKSKLTIAHIHFHPDEHHSSLCASHFLHMFCNHTTDPSIELLNNPNTLFGLFADAIHKHGSRKDIVYVLSRRYRDCHSSIRLGYWMTGELFARNFNRVRSEDLRKGLHRFTPSYGDAAVVVAFHLRLGDLSPSNISAISDARTLPYQNATTLLWTMFRSNDSLMQIHGVKWRLMIYSEERQLESVVRYMGDRLGLGQRLVSIDVMSDLNPVDALDGLATSDILLGASSGFTGLAAAINDRGIAIQGTYVDANLLGWRKLYGGEVREFNRRVCLLRNERLRNMNTLRRECRDRFAIW